VTIIDCRNPKDDHNVVSNHCDNLIIKCTFSSPHFSIGYEYVVGGVALHYFCICPFHNIHFIILKNLELLHLCVSLPVGVSLLNLFNC
jgi:hypothetical protein